MKINKSDTVALIIVVVILVCIIPIIYNTVVGSFSQENNCIEEEKYYYRLEGGFLFMNRVETTEQNSDGFDYRCLEWEEELSFGALVLGQDVIHNKGFSEKSETD